MNRLWACGVSGAVAMALALAAAPAQAETVKLKLAFLSSDRQQTYVAVVKPFIDAVNAEGKGIIEIVSYPGGVLSHDAAEQVMLLKNGAADIAWVVPGVTPNVFPDNGVFELPGLFDNTGEATRAYSKILATQTLKGYQDFFVLGAFASEPETIHTKAPVKALSDLKGLRISTNNSQSDMTFKALGIVPVELPLPGAAEAIGKGQIDGSASPLVPVVDFGIAKVATYHYLLHTSVTPLLLLMNRQTFDGLPKAAQDVLVKFSGNWVEQRYIDMNTAAGESVLQQLRANPARTVILPSLADQATARGLCQGRRPVAGTRPALPRAPGSGEVGGDEPARCCPVTDAVAPTTQVHRFSWLHARVPRGAKTLRSNLVLFGLMSVLLVAGTWGTAWFTTERLLFAQATSEADNWADYLAHRLPDLESIASGQLPSNDSMAFLQGTITAGEVFRYEIFNRAGYSQLVSDHGVVSLVDLSEYSAGAARSIETGDAVVDVQQGLRSEPGPGQASAPPEFYARAYVPVIIDGRPIAVVSAYVDQTEARDRFYLASLFEGGVLCLLSGLSFGIPVIAWYRRSKEKQRADQQIRYLAHHDALTGLFNRATFVQALDREFNRLPVTGSGFAVHMIDIDRFKEVNDTFGHDGGDFLLKTIAERLLATTRSGDMLARLGGDEFVAIQPQAKSLAEVDEFARRLSSALAPTIHFNGQEIHASISIGCAWAPSDGDTPLRIMKSADLGLYQAKADGRNCIRFFKPEMDAALSTRIALENAIRTAIANDYFEVHYQPIFDIKSRDLIGFEALVRLPGPDGELIPPTTFIPVAEDLRLIDKVGTWVLRAACTAAASWPSHLTVAVNLSPGQFVSGSISELVASILLETGLTAHRLELEITEGLLLPDSGAIMAELRKLKALGVAIVMDDFGTGYSSLGYLWRFPFDKIKIDRSFMEGFGGADRDAETVVKTIVSLGEELHVNVTIEGVETATQMDFLETIQGKNAQGFFLGRPMPLDAVGACILSEFGKSLAVRDKALLSAPATNAVEA